MLLMTDSESLEGFINADVMFPGDSLKAKYTATYIFLSLSQSILYDFFQNFIILSCI